MLLPLDHSKIKGLANIDARFLDLYFDPQNTYSIPYFWGTLGIVYNDKVFTNEEIQHWNDLWTPKLRDSLMLIDGAREVMGLSVEQFGLFVEQQRRPSITSAADKLNRLTPNVKAIVADEIKMYMINEEGSVAVTFSGEAADMMSRKQ